MMFSKEEIANEMKIFLDEKDIYIDEPMSKHTTFKIGGKADVFVKLRNTDQISVFLYIQTEQSHKEADCGLLNVWDP